MEILFEFDVFIRILDFSVCFFLKKTFWLLWRDGDQETLKKQIQRAFNINRQS